MNHIKNSIFVASLSSLIGVIISLAIVLFTFMGKWKSKIYKAMLLAMISPPFDSSLVLITLFGRSGLITYNLLGLSVNSYGWI